MMVTSSDSMYSRTEVRPRSRASAATAWLSALVSAAGAAPFIISSFHQIPRAELFERLLRGRLLGFLLRGTHARRIRQTDPADLDPKRLLMVRAGFSHHSITCRAHAALLQPLLQRRLVVGKLELRAASFE